MNSFGKVWCANVAVAVALTWSLFHAHQQQRALGAAQECDAFRSGVAEAAQVMTVPFVARFEKLFQHGCVKTRNAAVRFVAAVYDHSFQLLCDLEQAHRCQTRVADGENLRGFFQHLQAP
jgi:hypothetical protein